MKTRKILSFVLALAMCGGAAVAVVVPSGCATMKAPASLSPVGSTAFYARRVILAVEQIQTLAIEGEQADAISTEDARTVVNATKVAAEAGVSLAQVLGAGADATSARQRAAAQIKTALEEVLPKLSPNTRTMVEPYVKTALMLLTVFAGF